MVSARNLKTEERRQLAVAMKKDGVSVKEIASKLGVGVSSVHKYIRENTATSIERRVGDGVAMIDEALAEIRETIDWAKSCFHRSRLDRERTVTRTKGENGEEITTTVEGQAGDPRFLQVILNAVDQKCKLLGIYAPIKLDHGQIPAMLEVVVETRDELITVRQIIDGSNPEGTPNPSAPSASEVLDV